MTTIEELGSSFHRKLVVQINDAADQCNEIDMEPVEFLKLVITTLSYEMIRSAMMLSLSEEKYIEMNRIAYRSLMPVLKKAMQ